MTDPETHLPHVTPDDHLQPPPSVVAPNPTDEVETERSGPAVVEEWAADLRAAELARVEAAVDRGVPWKHIQRPVSREVRSVVPTVDAMAVVAAARAERRQRRVLTEIGLRHLGNPPFDQFAQIQLPYARRRAELASEEEIAGHLDRHLGRGDAERKRLAAAPDGVQREALAWELAKEEARRMLNGFAAGGATRAELDAVTASLERPRPAPERHRPADGDVRVLNGRGERLPAAAFFAEQGASPFEAEEWAALPTRPVVQPAGKPPADPAGLAAFVFDKVLYSSQVCDRKGQAVGVSPEVRQDYVDKIRRMIERGEPIMATEYAPLVAISNPIKRHTQEPALAEIDMLRRLAEVAQAVEQYYEPGMRWLLGNEATVFQGPHFGLPEDYVRRFHDRSRELAWLVDPMGHRLEVFDQADLTWGTPERRAQWEAYEQRRLGELEAAFNDWRHPDHEATRAYLNTYIYPMATCISPYQFEPAQGLSVREIADVYAAIKEGGESQIRGVGATDGAPSERGALSPAQAALLEDLLAAAHDLTFQYRVTMDSRDELPAFAEAIPPDAIKYTMVTKRDKAVLYPNSGRGANFPAHGEPVLLRPRDPRQRTAVTVRPWWQIAGASEDYTPMYTDGREEPLYFEERRS